MALLLHILLDWSKGHHLVVTIVVLAICESYELGRSIMMIDTRISFLGVRMRRCECTGSNDSAALPGSP